MRGLIFLLLLFLLTTSPPPLSAQTETTTQEAGAEDTANLLTQAELENLVAPVALYPDTLLIQVLVAATYPLEIVKADAFVKANADLDEDALKAAIDEQEYDESVAVLATAFPDVLADMATHVDWTDSIGTAMLAQSEDVLAAVQTMRNQAINTGALVSGEEQTVSVDDGAVVVQPTDPEVVYVPQYDTQTVYSNNTGDILGTALITFGTIAIIDEIFDNDDPWNDYWGCRNCGGWGGGPIYRNPDIDIDVDGNVNIGNDIDLGNRPDRRPDGGWKPEDGRKDKAREKISDKRGPDGKTKLPTNKGNSRGDQMRQQLSNKTGVADISRNPGKAKVDRPSTRPGSTKRDAINRTGQRPSGAKAPIKKPSTKKAAPKQANRKPAKRSAPKRKTSATKKRAPAKKSRAASSRGKAAGGARKGRR